ncbi:MAG: helix-turn-helix domain-containing protein [Polyangiaceae bacterium]|nr:helix-turn-helix domain-containing protein [Polyangiaceae bacterium]
MENSAYSPPSLSIQEVADRLKLPTDQVMGLVESGDLKSIRTNDEVRIAVDSFVIYMMRRASSDIDKYNAPRDRVGEITSAFLPLTLGGWFLATCVMVFSIRGGKPIFPVHLAVGVLGGWLLGAWWMATRAHGFHAVNGLGTTIYGNTSSPMGRVGTQWLILAGLPLLPIRSYVILEATDEKPNWVGTIREKSYRLRNVKGIYWRQAAPLMIAVWLGVAALVGVAVAL